MEVLKIPNFEYTLDEQGHVFSLITHKYISVVAKDNGMLSVRLYQGGRVFTYSLFALYSRVFKTKKLIRKLYTDIKDEVWKSVPIEGYSDRYFVSNFGRVKSRINFREKLLSYNQSKPSVNSMIRVSLSKNKKRQYFYVYSLVLAAFKDIYPGEYKKVIYIDHNRYNNHIENINIIF